MAETARLDKQIKQLIVRAETEAYKKGVKDARLELLKLLGEQTEHEEPVRKRAPRGSVPKFTKKVLSEYEGLKPREIKTLADSPAEKRINIKSIYSELQSGQAAGRYCKENGKWFLAK